MKTNRILFFFSIGIFAIYLHSCKREAITHLEGKITESNTPPQYVEKLPFEFETSIRLPAEYVDKNGNGHPIPSKNNYKGALSPTGDGCDLYDYTVYWDYRGYILGNGCFGTYPNPDETEFFLNWDLVMPADINIIDTSYNIARVRLRNSGFFSAPSGTGYRSLSLTYSLRETFEHPLEPGLMMKKWRVSAAPTAFNTTDWCLNGSYDITVRVMTDCMVFQQSLATFGFYQMMPVYAMARGALVGSEWQMEVYYNLPLCYPPNCRELDYTDSIIFEYRAFPALPSDPWTKVSRSGIGSFYISVPPSTNYEYRSKCRIYESPEIFTDYSPVQIVSIP